MGKAQPDNDTGLRGQVLEIIARQALCAPEALGEAVSLDALGIDSLGRAEIIFAVEETFDVAVPFNANTPDAGGFDLNTVGGVVAGVEALVRAARG